MGSYEHRVHALLTDGPYVPLPINRSTINAVFDVSLQNHEEVKNFLDSLVLRNEAPENAAEYLMAHIGRELTDLFFRPYTRKMWAMDLEEVDAAVVKRIPIRYDDEDRYFPSDMFQMLPKHGYTNLFTRILDHPNIRVALEQPFDAGMLAGYAHTFSSAPIDEHFGFAFGPLPYRSIKFHHRDELAAIDEVAPTVNFTDYGSFTRETDWGETTGPSHRWRRDDHGDAGGALRLPRQWDGTLLSAEDQRWPL